eukprot:CAMPEP_0197449044 /NCGR_PEP_ID=MMETSP1175-20131217/20030_1 /TAXON_ID=1003142 /ORGANISM="Triceratium dubium, Strain CCMP147" /LENGTH=34 /DNA_ID= /DNA_START= /DNA_END= /DNA_ORIENTATION=
MTSMVPIILAHWGSPVALLNIRPFFLTVMVKPFS